MPNQKDASKTKKHRVEIRLSKAEFEEMSQKAKECNLTASSYLRLLASNHRPKSFFDKSIYLELSNHKANLAKLGNLLKMALNDSARFNARQIDYILTELQNTKAEIDKCLFAILRSLDKSSSK